ncbi:MAG: sigma-70 family RNA polymerase sigma factor [Bacteroidetes bacterium]|nr:sigma-70 family RNA polymerase sigma factor [Bacteroidota bacterium]
MDPKPNFSLRAKEDFNLVQSALIDKDEKAYSSLMARYRDSLYFLILKMVHNQEDAEDLTFEAFSKAFKNLQKYDPQYSFSTWLFKIAVNGAIDFIRKKKRQKASVKKTFSIDDNLENADGETIEFNLKSPGLDPEEKIIKDQRIELVHDIVEKLSPRYKRLIELRYFKEMSYQEIADHLKQPLGTIKAQLARARDIFQNIIKNTSTKF